jgi:hypothetical protein
MFKNINGRKICIVNIVSCWKTDKGYEEDNLKWKCMIILLQHHEIYCLIIHGEP